MGPAEMRRARIQQTATVDCNLAAGGHGSLVLFGRLLDHVLRCARPCFSSPLLCSAVCCGLCCAALRLLFC